MSMWVCLGIWGNRGRDGGQGREGKGGGVAGQREIAQGSKEVSGGAKGFKGRGNCSPWRQTIAVDFHKHAGLNQNGHQNLHGIVDIFGTS